jgi:hypothetical protein
LLPVHTIHHGGGLNPILPPRIGDQFGSAVAALGSDRFVVGVPLRDAFNERTPDVFDTVANVGEVRIYRTNGTFVGVAANPRGDAGAGDEFGAAVAGLGSAGFIVGAPNWESDRAPSVSNAGIVWIFNQDGRYIGSISNPNPAEDDHFGAELAALGPNLAVIGAPSDDAGGADAGRAYLYSLAGATATLLKTIPNPAAAAGDQFGSAMALVGTNRLVIGARRDDTSLGAATGQVHLFDLQGTPIKSIAPITSEAIIGLAPGDLFGSAVAGVGTNWFAVGAPEAHVQETQDAGRVYLFDFDGSVLRSIDNPDPQVEADFGFSITGVGDRRFLVGARTKDVGNIDSAGVAYLYNLEGVILARITNPEPGPADYFGHALTSIGTDRFVIAAPRDDTNHDDSGSVYIYYAPILEYRLGSEIPRPGDFPAPANGPVITPSDMAFWHPPSQKLYAVKPGNIVIDWTPSEQDQVKKIVDQALGIWPPNEADYQIHVANTPEVDLSAANRFLTTELRAQDDGVGTPANMVSGKKAFAATGPGRSLLLLSTGAIASTNDVFFQLVKTVAWNDPAHLQDNVPTVIGQEITSTNHHPAAGAPFAYWANSHYLAASARYSNYYSRSLRTGPIIPVNRHRAPSEEDDLVVVFYQQAAKTLDGSGNKTTSDSYWPWKPVRYLADWPANPEKLVIAHTDPSTRLAIDAARHLNWDIYVQNNAALPGFNPNDEHAIRWPHGAGEAIFPLRDDLGSATTSEPYVLVTYQEDAGNPAFSLADIVDLDSLVAKLIGGSNAVSSYVWSRAAAPTLELFNRFNQRGWDFTIIKQLLVGELNALVGGDLLYDAQRFSDVVLSAATSALLGQNPPPTGPALARLNRMLLDDAFPQELARWQFVENLLRPRVLVFNVVAQEAPYFFEYPGLAGARIQAPFPLSAIQDPDSPQSAGVSGPYWRDRKQAFWAKAAGNSGGAAEIVMRFFYKIEDHFYFPESYYAPATQPPAPGTHLPWLDLRAGTPGIPIDIHYTIQWPVAPELSVAETLVEPKRGLPGISLQTSVDIIYQQSVARGQGPSAQVIDPTREHEVDLAQIPNDVTTINSGGKIYFPGLPPQLRNRFTYDPIDRRLEFRGELVKTPAGIEKYYLLLNVITAREKSVLLDLSQTTSFQAAVNALAAKAASVIEVTPATTKFDSLALTAGFAEGTGFVTLAFANNEVLAPEASRVGLAVIKVSCPLYQGDLKVIASDNPFDEKLTLRHSGDFAGRPGDYLFEWRTLPPDPITGLPPARPPEQWANFNPVPASGQGAVDITIAGSGLFTLSDNWFICRYRPTSASNPCGPASSAWTEPMLAEGWIKRVLRNLNPFEQRIKDYQQTQVNTIVNMIGQAGPRWEGNVPLNNAGAKNFGLIEIYETVLQRGLSLSVEGTPPVDYPPANDALLLAAGRLADLYMLLGNEAYADAADPTIAYGTDDGVYGAEASSIHSFMNQVPSLLEEELALLRGRDDSKLPSVQTSPVYNRLIWNFTSAINGGEVAYALNYNIQDQNGAAAGTIGAAAAALLYPQGHGDAWGHYLMASKNYYRLIRNPNFTWVPRIEAVLVGGVPVSVDFLDERKFAQAAAAKAQAGAEIVNLTYRGAYTEDPSGQYQGYLDKDPNRAWGLSEWASRAGQGAYFDWIVGNALLPEKDTNPSHSGIQVVDRTTVTELREIPARFVDIQAQLDTADIGLNPLGLAKNVVPFDIDPAAVAQGRTHFEQIYERAVKAMNNAIAVFNHANNSTQLLRRQADTVNEFQEAVVEREADFNNRLIELFGYPYSDDIGPTGAYPTGYDGPDYYHYEYVDASELLGDDPPPVQIVTVPVRDFAVDDQGALKTQTLSVTFHFSTTGVGMIKPASWTGKRRAPGDIQLARSELLQTRARFEQALIGYDDLVSQIQEQANLLKAQHNVDAQEINILTESKETQRRYNDWIGDQRELQLAFRTAAKVIPYITEAAVTVIENPIIGPLIATIQSTGGAITESLNLFADISGLTELDHQQAKEIAQLETNLKLTTLHQEQAILQHIAQLEQLVRKEASLRLEIATLQETLSQVAGRYLAALARAQRLLEDRLRFRQQTAAKIQSYRYKDMAFRIFRNDALQKYRAQFDLAARYVYLAAKAYDYETNLQEGDPRGPGQDLMTRIIRSRSLGLFQNGLPLTGSATGDPGLADPLARMFLNWDLVLKGQLGFNNPQTETGRFSLRSELFRVQPGFQGNQVWRETLSRHVVANVLDVPEFNRYCIPFQPAQPVEPAIVIPFSTTVNFGLNFFGWPAGGGDNDYDSTHFATKVRTVGVWFANYNNLGGGMINTPRVYLIPVGDDILRSPTSKTGEIREWRILDQALPVPFPLSGGALNNMGFIPGNDTLLGEFAELRRYARFRAYHDSGSFNPAETIADSRLIGRSVWNTRWLLIIPAGTLHSNRQEGIARFIHGALLPNGTRDGNGVSDIKIFFQTYAYAGN